MRREHKSEQTPIAIPTPIVWCPFSTDYVDIINNITVPDGGTTISNGYIHFGDTGTWQEVPFYSQNTSAPYYSILAPVKDFTVSLEANVYDNTNNPLFMVLTRNSASYLIAAYCENGRIYVKQGSGFTSSGTYTNNQWNKIAVTYSGTTIKIYVNGTLTVTHATSYNSSQSNCNSFRLGRNIWGAPSTYLYGGIKNFRVWNSILTDEQIAVL